MFLELVSRRKVHRTIWIISDDIRGEGNGQNTRELFSVDF
jgi:hypothetical protein